MDKVKFYVFRENGSGNKFYQYIERDLENCRDFDGNLYLEVIDKFFEDTKEYNEDAESIVVMKYDNNFRVYDGITVSIIDLCNYLQFERFLFEGFIGYYPFTISCSDGLYDEDSLLEKIKVGETVTVTKRREKNKKTFYY